MLYHLAYNISARGVKCFELLLALGANVNLRGYSGETACREAAFYRNRAALCACLAFGADMDEVDNFGRTTRDFVVRSGWRLPTDAEIDAARRRIARVRLDLVRQRAFQVCIGLQSLNLDALCMCEILMQSCGSFVSLIDFHQWWNIATAIKHFH